MGKLVREFEDLIAWQKGVDLAVGIYEMTGRGKFTKDFRLADQIQSAAVSVPSNIAEGFERDSRPEFRRFLSIAKASCGEVRTQVEIAKRLSYIDDESYAACIAATRDLSRIIGKLRASIKVSTRHLSLVTRH
jgi:four helix bundle protein